MTEDIQWLEEYARTGSQEAFARLVEANLGLVYSAAMRQLGDHHLAEDVTQQAFIKLAKKASRLPANVPPAGWLVLTARYLVRDAKRAAARRTSHEQKAAAMRSQAPQPQPSDPWGQIEPLLDEALCSLGSADRTAVTLRYLQGRNVEQVAEALNVSRDAAAQRLHRAIGRLRGFMKRRGVAVDQAALGSLMLSQGFHPPPPELAVSILKSATAAHGGVGAGFVSKGAAMAVTATKVKIATAASVVALAVGGAGTAIYKAVQPRSGVVVLNPAAPAQALVPPPAANEPAWRANFNRVYSLAPGQALKRIQGPYIPERNTYLSTTDPKTHSIFHYGREAQSNGYHGEPYTFLLLTHDLLGLRKYDFDGLRSLGDLQMPGDWIVRQGASAPSFLRDLQGIVSSQLGRQIRFVPRMVERDVLVGSGTVHFHQLPGEDDNEVAIYVKDRSKNLLLTAARMNDFLGEIGELLGLKAINETSPKDAVLMWHYHIEPGVILHGPERAELLGNLTEQTGIKFHIERRRVQIWFVEPPSGPAAI